jgi:hypothetical protein
MRRRGINYDTGFAPFGDRLSRESLDPAQVRREMAIIARDLHCNAVRITGRDPDRISLAAESALESGLEVLFSPFPCDLTPDELVPYFAACARFAERLRGRSPRVVFVLGCEMTLFDRGFVPGASVFERLQAMMNPALLFGQDVSPEELERRFDAFLGRAVAAERREFAGPVTYASAPWENVDWRRFDIVSVDHYRDASNRDSYREGLRPYFAPGRAVVVTEFGCSTYHGASDRGALGWT